jgi:hypothetical protein
MNLSLKAIVNSILGLVVCSTGALIALHVSSPHETAFGFSELSETGAHRMLYIVSLGLFAMAGIVGSALWESLPYARISTNPDRISLSKAFQIGLTSASFWKAVIVSPIVFAAVYSIVRTEPDVVFSHLVAFENGFFWNTILKSKIEAQI